MSEERKIGCYTVGSSAVTFEDEMDFDSISCLMDCIDVQINKEDFSGILSIYWSSHGGRLRSVLDLAFYIKSLPRDIEIVFIINEDTASGGSFIIYELIDRCDFVIADSCHVMFHTAHNNFKSRKQDINKVMTESTAEYDMMSIERFEMSGFPKNYIKRFKDGDDVYIKASEFKKYLQNYLDKINKQNDLAELEILEAECEMRRGFLGVENEVKGKDDNS